MKKTMLSLLIIAALAASVSALMNPSSVYCEAMGYSYIVEHTADGDWGYCQVDGKKVESWSYLQGKSSPDKTYCAKKGYTLKTVNDPVKCAVFGLPTCAVCVLADGSEVEVTLLMNLSFTEGECGDGTCGFPENHNTCPKDCPTGGFDSLCDGVKDGICDPDCEPQNITSKDPDCPLPTTTTLKQATTTTVKVTTTAAPKATLPDTKPLEPQPPQNKGCWPLLLAPLSLLAAALGKALRIL